MVILKKGKEKKGFTLVELIAVVAILIILAVILVPNIVGYVNRSKIAALKSDAKIVVNIIKTAQAKSDDPSKITDYTTATTAATGDANLAASKDPEAGLKNKGVDDLEKNVIDNTSEDWSKYSTYK